MSIEHTPRQLTFARGQHPPADRRGVLAGLIGGQLLRRQRRHLHLQVDTVEQRTREARLITLDLCRRAVTGLARIAQMATGAGIHRRDQLEACRIAAFVAGPSDMDTPRFHGFTHHLQHMTRKLRQLIEEQHAVMGQGDLAGARFRTTAHQRHGTGGMMRRAEGPPAPLGTQRQPADRAYRRHLQRLLFGQRRQDARQATGQHGLAGAGRPGEEQVVAAGGGHLQGAAGLKLSAYLGQVGQRPCRLGRARQAMGRDRSLAQQVGHHLEQMIGGQYLELTGQRRLIGIGPRHNQPPPRAARRQGQRQHPLHTAKCAVQRQLADAFGVLQTSGRQLSRGEQQPQGDGQIEATTLLGQVGGSQVEGDTPQRVFEAGIDQGAAHPLPTLLHRRLRQADQRHAGQAVGEVHFHLHLGCLQAEAGPGVHDRQRHGRSLANGLPSG